MARAHRRIAVILFEGFELLDVFGPVELFSRVPADITVDLVGPTAGPVHSSQGTAVVAQLSYARAPVRTS